MRVAVEACKVKMAVNCLSAGKERATQSHNPESRAEGQNGKAEQTTASMAKEAPVVRAGPARDTVGAPVRGPARPGAMQAQISAALGSCSSSSFASFDVAGPPSKQASFDVPTGPPTKGPQGPPSKELIDGSGGDKHSGPDRSGDAVEADAGKPKARDAKKGPSMPVVQQVPERGPPAACASKEGSGVDTPADPSGEDAISSEDEDEVPDEKDKVRRYLERMRGSGSKDMTKDLAKKVKKDKKEKKKEKEKNKLSGQLKKGRAVQGPPLSKEQLKEKKKKDKQEKKLLKARKKENEKERMLIAAERETKRIFGRSALVIGSSSSSAASAVSAQSQPSV